MLVRVLQGVSGGGIDSDNMKELSLIDGTSSNVAVQNINGTTNEVVFPSGSYIWQGQYLKNDFTSSPRTIKAVKNCRAISIDEYGNCITRDYSNGDTILSWNMGNMGNVNRVIGAIVLNDHHTVLGGGVVEGHIMIRTEPQAGMQIIFNETTNTQRTTSGNWTGNYISYNDSTGDITAIQDCRVSYKVENGMFVTSDYRTGDVIVNSKFQNINVGSNIQTYVLA